MVRGVQRRHAMPWRDEKLSLGRPVKAPDACARIFYFIYYWVSAAQSRTGPDRKHAIHLIHPSGRARAHLGWEAISHRGWKKTILNPEPNF
jgi:hypothetical protein